MGTVTEARPCPSCGVLRPWPTGYAVDKSKPSGRKSSCKPCDAAAAATKRARQALESTPIHLLPPPPPPDPQRQPQLFLEAVPVFLESLVPPVGPQDAPLVTALWELARAADTARGTGDVQLMAGLIGHMTRCQRELAATRAAKASSGAPTAPPKSKIASFREAL